MKLNEGKYQSSLLSSSASPVLRKMNINLTKRFMLNKRARDIIINK